jgi:hypothetical protein
VAAMSDVIQFSSHVGDDGVLDVRAHLGQSQAGKEVVITIDPVGAGSESGKSASDWHQFIERTYGSCAGQGLVRHDQGEFEQREPIE